MYIGVYFAVNVQLSAVCVHLHITCKYGVLHIMSAYLCFYHADTLIA